MISSFLETPLFVLLALKLPNDLNLPVYFFHCMRYHCTQPLASLARYHHKSPATGCWEGGAVAAHVPGLPLS